MDKTQSMVAKFDCRVHFNHLLCADLTQTNEQGARPFDQIWLQSMFHHPLCADISQTNGQDMVAKFDCKVCLITLCVQI